MFLSDVLVVFAVTAAVVFAFGRARVPSVVGLLVSGVLVGPHGLSLVADEESVKLLAEIGVIVLLFTVGLEFSMSRLAAMLPMMARIGLPQILGTTAIVAAATWWYLGTLPQAVFAGLLVAMSSTAIVMKMLAVPLLAEAAGTRPAATAALVTATVVAIILAKTVVTAIPTMLAGFPPRTSLLAGAPLAQVGEFSFVLGSRGAELGLLDGDDYQTFLAAAVVTMAATPLLAGVMPWLLERLSATAWCGRLLAAGQPETTAAADR